jgi:hypothetical protein
MASVAVVTSEYLRRSDTNRVDSSGSNAACDSRVREAASAQAGGHAGCVHYVAIGPRTQWR